MNFRLRMLSTFRFATLLVAIGMAGCASAPTPVKEVVGTKDAPTAIGPYSQALKAGNLLFLSGQIAIDPKTNQMSTGSIEEQTKPVVSQRFSEENELSGLETRF